MKPLAPNTLLQNRYKIVHLIGKGGMGEVYLAVDQRLGSAMALKRTTVGDDPLLAEAFEREAKTLANLRHSVLPKVSDHFLENDEQYLVMDHISGEDLSERLKESQKPFPLNWVMFWADQLLEALTYLHTNVPPIIHRDIKPQNLKLTDDNQIVLLDFGLSKHALGQTRVTTSGSIVGYTPHYAPMEQIRGTGTDARSDIYSLSATLYQLLTGIVPPDALTRADGFLSGMGDPLRAINELNSEVPKSVSDIIINGMEVSQEKRPAAARDMQKDLRRAFNLIADAPSTQAAPLNFESAEDSGGIGEKTEVMSAPPLSVGQFSSGIDSELNSSDQSAMPPNSYESGNLDATVQISNEDISIPNTEKDLMGMKTEVLLDRDSSNKSEHIITKDYAEKDFSTKDDYSEIPSDTTNQQEFSNSENVETDNESYTENSINNKTGGFSGDEADSFEDEQQPSEAAASYGLTDDFNSSDKVDAEADRLQNDFDSQPKENLVETPPPSVAAKKGNSAGKYAAMLGGLGVVLFLLLGTALGIGWYMYGGGSTTADDTNTTVTPQPSVEPTADTAEADTTDETNTNSNSDEDLANTNTEESTDDTSIEPKDTTVTSTKTKSAQTTTTTKNTPRPTPRVAVKKTPVVRSTPVKKAEPKKTQTSGSRTDIIQ